MNFYKRHIGDYIKDAGHLTLLEHGVYARLMDVYYTREAGIPEDKAARLIGARSKDEINALKSVLSEFFYLEDSLWIQNRCEAEIEATNAQANANRTNGKKGGRPKRIKTGEEPTNNPMGFISVNENNLIQTPDSRHQTPDLKPEPSLVTSTVVGAAENPVERSRNVDISILLRAAGVKPMTAMHPEAMAWASNPAVTDQILHAAVESARQYKPTGDISPNYLKPIIEQLINPPEPKPQKQPQDAWWLSNPGIERKGRELGLQARGTESYNDFKDRIFAEIRKRDGGKAA